ncbi:MAG: carboxypeptidase regulatory-like domain-containing protein [Acidobacteria bacterium]|nr:carboxypeptidase regulatory-like domain-containing protein [Acidobacteriota bacterium]
MIRNNTFRVGLALAALSLPSFAQITGDLVIRVSDPSAAAVVGAKVKVVSSAQGSVREVSTDTAGSARFSLLSVGDYSSHRLLHPLHHRPD